MGFVVLLLSSNVVLSDPIQQALDGKYAAALKALRDDTREWWLETIEDGEDASCDAVTLFSDQSKTIEDTSLVT